MLFNLLQPRQIEFIKRENCTFEKELTTVLRICALEDKDKITSDLLQTRYQSIMIDYAKNSFCLCSLKSTIIFYENLNKS